VTFICRNGRIPDKDLLAEIVKSIYEQEGIRCYFCQIIGRRWSFLAGDAEILAAPVKYMITAELGIIADREIADLAKYIGRLEKRSI
jgi:hypothetical protein